MGRDFRGRNGPEYRSLCLTPIQGPPSNAISRPLHVSARLSDGLSASSSNQTARPSQSRNGERSPGRLHAPCASGRTTHAEPVEGPVHMPLCGGGRGKQLGSRGASLTSCRAAPSRNAAGPRNPADLRPGLHDRQQQAQAYWLLIAAQPRGALVCPRTGLGAINPPGSVTPRKGAGAVR